MQLLAQYFGKCTKSPALVVKLNKETVFAFMKNVMCIV